LSKIPSRNNKKTNKPFSMPKKYKRFKCKLLPADQYPVLQSVSGIWPNRDLRGQTTSLWATLLDVLHQLLLLLVTVAHLSLGFQ
jgi:hypothetical protein